MRSFGRAKLDARSGKIQGKPACGPRTDEAVRPDTIISVVVF
jgi:hypothetical protein